MPFLAKKWIGENVKINKIIALFLEIKNTCCYWKIKSYYWFLHVLNQYLNVCMI